MIIDIKSVARSATWLTSVGLYLDIRLCHPLVISGCTDWAFWDLKPLYLRELGDFRRCRIARPNVIIFATLAWFFTTSERQEPRLWDPDRPGHICFTLPTILLSKYKKKRLNSALCSIRSQHLLYFSCFWFVLCPYFQIMHFKDTQPNVFWLVSYCLKNCSILHDFYFQRIYQSLSKHQVRPANEYVRNLWDLGHSVS